MSPTTASTPRPHSDPDPFAKFIGDLAQLGGELLPSVLLAVGVLFLAWFVFYRND